MVELFLLISAILLKFAGLTKERTSDWSICVAVIDLSDPT